MGINEIIQVGNQIKEIRKLLGFTQKEIARRAGIPYTTYSNYENNNREPSSEQLRKITNALNVPLSVLLENNELSRNYRSRLREYNDIRKNTSYSTEYKQQILDKYDSELERIKKELEFEDKQREEAARKAPKFIAYDENGNKIEVKNDKPPKFTDKSTSFEESKAQEEAHNLIDSIPNEEPLSWEREKIALQLRDILSTYSELNDAGREAAVKRIEELRYSDVMTDSRLDDIYFNRVKKKINKGERLSSDEIEWWHNYLDKSVKTVGAIFESLFSMLNEEGRRKAHTQINRAIDQIEMLTKIPEYQKKAEVPPQE